MEACLWLSGGLMDYTPARNPRNEISVDVISARRRAKKINSIKTKVLLTLLAFDFQIPNSALLCRKFSHVESLIGLGWRMRKAEDLFLSIYQLR